MTLKEKIESSLLAYLQPLAEPGQPLRSVPLLPGHTAGKRRLPCVIVYAERRTPNDAFPPGTGIYDVSVKVYVLTQVDDEDSVIQGARVQASQDRLNDTDALRAALNAPAENRPVTGLHIYDFIENPDDEGRDERHFGEVLNYTAICQGVDGA